MGKCAAIEGNGKVMGVAEIEAGVKPLCEALNLIPGTRTLWSCHGHLDWPSRPYVTFEAPQDTAFKIHGLLGDGKSSGVLRCFLKYNWWLVANFRDDGSMQYTIEPNDYHFDCVQFSFWWRPTWKRWQVDDDLRWLALLIEEEVAREKRASLGVGQ